MAGAEFSDFALVSGRILRAVKEELRGEPGEAVQLFGIRGTSPASYLNADAHKLGIELSDRLPSKQSRARRQTEIIQNQREVKV